MSVVASFSSEKQKNVSPSGDLFYRVSSLKKETNTQLVSLDLWLKDKGDGVISIPLVLIRNRKKYVCINL